MPELWFRLTRAYTMGFLGYTELILDFLKQDFQGFFLQSILSVTTNIHQKIRFNIYFINIMVIR